MFNSSSLGQQRVAGERLTCSPNWLARPRQRSYHFRHGWPVAQVVCLFRQRCLHWALSCQACYKAAPHIWVLMSGISVSAITASRSARAYYEGTFIALTALCPCWTLAQCRLYIVRGLRSTVCRTTSTRTLHCTGAVYGGVTYISQLYRTVQSLTSTYHEHSCT